MSGLEEFSTSSTTTDPTPSQQQQQQQQDYVPYGSNRDSLNLDDFEKVEADQVPSNVSESAKVTTDLLSDMSLFSGQGKDFPNQTSETKTGTDIFSQDIAAHSDDPFKREITGMSDSDIKSGGDSTLADTLDLIGSAPTPPVSDIGKESSSSKSHIDDFMGYGDIKTNNMSDFMMPESNTQKQASSEHVFDDDLSSDTHQTQAAAPPTQDLLGSWSMPATTTPAPTLNPISEPETTFMTQPSQATTLSHREPTPPLREPTPPLREPTLPLREPTPPLREPTPPPREPTPPLREPTPPPRESTPPPRKPTPPREPTPPPREPTPPPKQPTPPPREPTPPPRQPTPPAPRREATPPLLEPVVPVPSKVSGGGPIQEAHVTTGKKTYQVSDATKASFAIFNPLVDLIYWRDVKKTGVVFGCLMVILLSLAYLSLISVVSYTSLAILSGTITFRVYKNIMQAVQKSQDGHPFKSILEKDTNLPADKVHEATDVIVKQINSSVTELKRLFLVEDLVDSVKFGCLLWCLTYLGSWFNGLTLVILAFVALFTLPKVYEQNQAQIDQYVGLVRTQVNDVMSKVKAALPIGNKEKSQ